METVPFSIEYHSDTPEFNDDLKDKVETRLQKLARGNRDITGASLAVQTASGDTLPHEYRVRIVIYQRPDNTTVIEKGPSVSVMVKKALDVVERQVRAQRDKLRRSRKRA